MLILVLNFNVALTFVHLLPCSYHYGEIGPIHDLPCVYASFVTTDPVFCHAYFIITHYLQLHLLDRGEFGNVSPHSVINLTRLVSSG